MVDSLYGDLPGIQSKQGAVEAAVVAGPVGPVGPAGPGQRADPAQNEDELLDVYNLKDAAPQPAPKASADDIFAQPISKESAAPGKVEEEKRDEKEPSKEDAAKAEPSKAFAAARLMMPPVRKKVEPISGNKRPLNPSLDLQKLQQEKEALMRQRASASSQAATASTTAASATSAGAPVQPGPVAADSSPTVSKEGASPVAASTPTSPVSLYGSPDEEYDPAKPNDYDEFCRKRLRQKAEEEMERRRQDALSRQQKAELPAAPKEDDYATRLMKKMGYKEGSGLGKDGQGMATPLIMQKTGAAQGQVVQGAAKREAPQQAAPAPAAKQQKTESIRPPSHILLLTNMVGAGEVDEDLEGETAEEAEKYGKLKRCKIKEIKGAPDDMAVRIFLEYEKVEDATKAMMDMNGRYFGGRVVKARFYDEEAFAKGELEKND